MITTVVGFVHAAYAIVNNSNKGEVIGSIRGKVQVGFLSMNALQREQANEDYEMDFGNHEFKGEQEVA